MSFVTKIKVEGIEAATRELGKFSEDIKQAASDGSYEFAQTIMDEWLAGPDLWRDTGALADSNFVTVPTLGETEVATGFVAPYTVHNEDNHPFNPGYLEKTYVRNLDKAVQAGAEQVEKTLTLDEPPVKRHPAVGRFDRRDGR